MPLAPIDVSEHDSEDRVRLIDLRDLWRSVLRSRWLVLSTTALTLAAATVFTALQEREYESEATIFVAPPRSGGALTRELSGLGGLGSLATLGQSGIATEAAVLQSRSITEAVVDSLALHVQLVEPRMSRVNALRVIAAPRDAVPGVYEFQLQPDGTYAVQARQFTDPRNVPSRVAVGEPARLGNVTLALATPLSPEPPARLIVEILPFDAAVRALRKQLEVSQPERGAQILSIRARSTDSVLAAAIPNSAARSFIAYRTGANQADARNSVAFLEEQVATYAAQLQQAEGRLQGYQEQARVVSPSDQASQQVRQFADLQARRDLLTTEREAIGALLARAEISSNLINTSSPYRELASFPVFLSNGAVQSILRTLTELENGRAELRIRRTPENIDVQRIDQRIRELELQLYETARSYRDGLNSQITSLNAALAQFGDNLEAVPAQQVTYARLFREKELLEQIYTLLQTRLKEAEIRVAEEPGDVRVLDAALVPLKPVAPRPVLNIALGLLIGLMLGTGTALMRAIRDPKMRSRTDAIAATRGLPVLGMIPHIPSSLPNGSRRRPWRRINGILPSRAEHGTPTALVTKSEPKSGAAEAYRSLRTTLTLPDLDRAPRVIVICSAAEREGKSTSAANLAVAMAQQGIRTLLIDCDLRKPELHRVFGLDPVPGVTDLLSRRTTTDEAVRRVELEYGETGLDVLLSGSPSRYPSEMAGSRAMRELLQQLRMRYDVVIVDVPPLGSAADAAVLAAAADSTVLVTRATVTHKRAVAEAVAQLRQLQIPLAGVVINDVDPTELSSYYQYGYGTRGDNA